MPELPLSLTVFGTLFIGARERNDQTREVEPNTGAVVAGAVMLGASLAAIPIGVVMLTGSRQSLEVKPAPGMQLSLGPGGLHGTF